MYRMQRIVLRSLIVLISICALAAQARSADLKDPKDIIKKSWGHINSLKSYSYTIWGEGWEKDLSDVEKRTKSATSEVASKYGSGIANKAGDAPKTPSKPKKMGYHVEYRFMKPFLLQMTVTQSDYVPKIIYGSLITYRPDNDPNVFWFKPRISPMAIKRDVKGESGTIFTSSMDLQFIRLDNLMKDVKPVLKGIKKVDGKDCYDVAFMLPGGKGAKVHPVDYKKWNNIPKEVRFAITKSADEFVGAQVSARHFLFDVKTLWLISSEEYDLDGNLKYTNWWRDIKENQLTDRDF